MQRESERVTAGRMSGRSAAWRLPFAVRDIAAAQPVLVHLGPAWPAKSRFRFFSRAGP